MQVCACEYKGKHLLAQIFAVLFLGSAGWTRRTYPDRFVDPDGDTIQVIAFSGVSYEEDARKGEAMILYNPKNSREAIILQFRDYLVIFFFPFALLLVWIGWPFHSDPENQKLETNKKL